MHKIATIGFFDGVHCGHRFLFAQLAQEALRRNLEPLICTFVQHPLQVLRGQCPPLLSTTDERVELLQQYGEVKLLDFEQVHHLSARQFMQYLHEQEGVHALLMGYDHRFGADRLQNFADYEHIAGEIGITVLRAEEMLIDNLPISSTRIRNLLNQDALEQANKLLGYAYAITGIVVHGNGIGAQIGFPTANIQIDTTKQLPCLGVYAATVTIDGLMYKAVVNIGTNPTVGNAHVSVEVHVIGYEGDLYGRRMTIKLLKYIRGERKFESLDQLKKQIEQDILQI